MRLALVLFSLIALGYLFIIGERILTPLLFSFLFAVLLLPLANFLENRARLSRGGASIISVILFITVISLIFYLLGSQLSSLSSEWPTLKNQLGDLFTNVQKWVMTTFHVDVQKQLAYINNATKGLLDSSTAILGETVLSVSSLFLFIIFILIYTFFLLYYRRLLVRFVTVAFTEKYAAVIADIISEIKSIIRGYIVGLFIEMAIVATIAIVIFLLLGIKYVFLLGLMIGIFNVIPYVGIFTALFISALVTFATTDGRHALFVALAVVGIHLVDSNFLMPRIVGSHVKINPLIVVLGVVAGEMFWGIPGMFLAVPYLAIAKVIFDRVDGLKAWGILFGEEEKTPAKTKQLQRWMKEKKK